ncbi:MAG: tetratricopeptide repeat protein [Betaproteobacteria bacterium]
MEDVSAVPRRVRLTRGINALTLGVALFSAGDALADEWTYLMHQGAAAYNRGEYREAVVHYEAAVKATETFPVEDIRRAGTLVSLASAYKGIRLYGEAESLYKKSLDILDAAGKPQQAGILLKLGELYLVQGRYAEAEESSRAAVRAVEKQFGPNHPNLARILKTFVVLVYRAQNRWDEVARLYRRSLEIYIDAYGVEHQEVATTFMDLAAVYERLQRYTDAEAIYKRALPVWIKLKGSRDESVAYVLLEIARMYRFQRRNAESEPLFKQALALLEKTLGPQHREVGVVLHYLAVLYEQQGRHGEADHYYRRWTAIQGGPARSQFRGTSFNGPLIVHQGR